MSTGSNARLWHAEELECSPIRHVYRLFVLTFSTLLTSTTLFMLLMSMLGSVVVVVVVVVLLCCCHCRLVVVSVSRCTEPNRPSALRKIAPDAGGARALRL